MEVFSIKYGSSTYFQAQPNLFACLTISFVMLLRLRQMVSDELSVKIVSPSLPGITADLAANLYEANLIKGN